MRVARPARNLGCRSRHTYLIINPFGWDPEAHEQRKTACQFQLPSPPTGDTKAPKTERDPPPTHTQSCGRGSMKRLSADAQEGNFAKIHLYAWIPLPEVDRAPVPTITFSGNYKGFHDSLSISFFFTEAKYQTS